MTTKVVNKRWTRPRADDVYVGRPGPFGNPFKVGDDGDLDAVLLKFHTWFLNKILDDHAFRAKVEALHDRRLACWCRPHEGFRGRLLCHAQIIAGYLDGIPPENVA
jgi:hypothetical protein